MGIALEPGDGRPKHDRRADVALRVKGSSAPVRLAVSFTARLRGLLGRAPDEALLLIAPCHSIHTFGMRHALDVAFIGRGGEVTAVYRAIGPARRLRSAQAVAVLERFAQPTPFFHEGDHLALDVATTKAERKNR